MQLDQTTETQLVVAVITLIGVVANWIKSNTNSNKIDANKAELTQKVDANTALTKLTHDSTNSKMDALIATTRDSSFRAGQQDQVAKQAVIEAAVASAATPPTIVVQTKENP
jgi:hypothetical protein